ncbi:malate synthase G [Paraglaciecola arctica]|uniref:Malate synthase G n=1 Tax=Paraglaciecola arctica BSs20135 TaxID=493475 RepID=K6YYZ4_9ALTE|nr:malate synthase G [Paraglaciecola arctica]GAC21973.1 malate synthase G [Paraglaciecola arctica BSs20135]
MQLQYIQKGRLKIANQLEQFITQDVLPGVQLTAEDLWTKFAHALPELLSINQNLLQKRVSLQQQIDQYCSTRQAVNVQEYKSFLTQIGYLQDSPNDFQISTQNVDPEIATMAGPQLVVPINNARFALNAANARWGSLYDALYGSDIIEQTSGSKTKGYDGTRGQKVIDYSRKWLDIIAPLKTGSHKQSKNYAIDNGTLLVTLADDSIVGLKSPEQFVGFQGAIEQPICILIKHNNIHAEIQFDQDSVIGQQDTANIKDICLESALTTIMDCEDSVTAVDAADKTLVYKNWLGLIKGDLTATISSGNKQTIRSLDPDRQYQSSTGGAFSLSGRSLMFIRNVGHLMTTDAILFDDKPIYEGIMDALVTSLIAKHDLLDNGVFKNSQAGSIYIVKPKMHGPEEVAFADLLFTKMETVLSLATHTLKIGLMDEERRTSLNLKACIKAAKDRVVFINTGFLDRTGDEIHTSMQLGAFATKASIKTRPWLNAYEQSNVITGINSGLSGKAQIGKGMWPTPDNMADMMQAKIAHVRSGANTAWVPSPTAATLHALHYHQESVFNLRMNMNVQVDGLLEQMLNIPLLNDEKLSSEQIQNELDNNVQGILGYVVRWINQGIGCSKVPDINNVGLMEDRATLRISSQHIANWLMHGVVTKEQVEKSMLTMAKLVDSQNKGDDEYINMTPDTQASIAFQAAHELIFKGKEQPNGYTEPVLHAKRQELKKRAMQ